MDSITRILFIFTGLIALCQSLPDDSKSLPDPSVFEMKPPEGLKNLFPFKFPTWSPETEKAGQQVKFPDWFYINYQPSVNIPVDKKAEKTESLQKPDNNLEWTVDKHETQYFYDSPNEEQLNAKDVFPSYYNVFGSSAYPSWMAFPFFQSGHGGEKKDENDIQVRKISVVKKTAEAKPNRIEPLTLKEEVKNIPARDEVLKPNESVAHDSENIKVTKDAPAIVSSNVVNDVKETIEDEKPNEVISIVRKSEIEKPVIAVVSTETPISAPVKDLLTGPNIISSSNIADRVGQAVNEEHDVPATSVPFDEVPISPHKSEDKTDISALTPSSTNIDIESFASKEPKENLMPDNYLYNLLQKIDFSKLSTMFTPSSDSLSTTADTPQIAAMLMPSEETVEPPPRSRSIVSGNNIVVNNADNLPNVDQRVNVPDALNTAQSSRPQNPVPKPLSHGNQPNTRPGTIPSNNNVNQGYPVYQNNNNYQNSGRPIYFNPFTNAVPVNHVSGNGGNYPVDGQQGNVLLFNGQPLQTNPGQVNVYGVYNPNAAAVNPGQNMYAIIPVTAVNGEPYVNVAQTPYVNNNLPVNYQIISSIPAYNLVPVNKPNVLTNTKDEVDE